VLFDLFHHLLIYQVQNTWTLNISAINIMGVQEEVKADNMYQWEEMQSLFIYCF